MLESPNFETFYKVFTMKDRKGLCQIKDIGKNIEKLVKTKWFKGKFEKMLEIGRAHV